jgi:DNA polymerase-3 subunit alpha
MDQIPRYIRNKNNAGEIKYDHPLLENILNVTYGCMVYQEQVMQIVRELAGYSMGRSDLVRRAMSKKKVSVMEQERKNFIYGIIDNAGNVVVEGAVKRGVDEKTANKIFDEMMDFASYAFNKSHAAAYAVVAYETAWLKYYYPVEFTAALLNSFLGSSDKVSQYVHDCRTMNIEVLPPDINESYDRFTVVNRKIRFGMAAVKNVGEGAVKEIIAEREAGGVFKSLREFCERMDGKDVNKRCIESLIKCGAFDSFGVYRSRMIAVYEKMIDSIQQNKKRSVDGQVSIFDMSNSNTGTAADSEAYPDIKEYFPQMLLSMEKEMLGLYISGHPLSEYEAEINAQVTLYSSDLGSKPDELEDNQEGMENPALKDGTPVVVGGIITGKKVKTTKSNNIMAFITLEDLHGTMEVIVFPAVLSRYSNLIAEESIVLVIGKISLKEGEEPKIICEEARPLKKNKAEKLYIKINHTESSAIFKSITSMLKYFKGGTPVCFYDESEKSVKVAEKECWVNLNDSLLSELRLRLGEENVKIL